MIFDPNELFFKMADLVANKSPESKLIIANEGGTRSSKTFDEIHLIVWICDNNRDKNLDIIFFRDSLVNCKELLLKDFKKCLKIMDIWDDRNYVGNEGKPNYNLFGHTIKFRGISDNSIVAKEASDSDIVFFNEVLSGCNQEDIKSWIMRCRKLVLMDWNPRYTSHWVFDMEKRSDTYFIKSNFRNNKHLEQSVIKEIESYSPWMFEDMELPEDERRPHLENIEAGTVDEFRWRVYGMGERANREGLVFPVVKWIDSFPTDIEEISHGCDFGQANPTAIVKIGIRRKPIKSDLYIQKLFYAPTENSDVVAEVMKRIAEQSLVEALQGKEFKSDKQKEEYIESLPTVTTKVHCDSNMGIETGWISDLRARDIAAFGTVKYPGSREYWISTIKRYNIHIVTDIDFRKEQENFCYRVVDGITLSETIKKHDHLWSATGYAVVGDFRVE